MDAPFAKAVRDAPGRIDGEPTESFLEERIERALIAALGERLGPQTTVGARRRFPIPGWEPQPGGVDLFALDQSDSPVLVAELKVDDVEPGVDCAPIFPSQNGPAQVWPSRDLFERYAAAWRWLLKGGRARPRVVPGAVEVSFVANERVRSYPDYELRAINVRAVPDAGLLAFDGDWPATAKAECASVRALPNVDSELPRTACQPYFAHDNSSAGHRDGTCRARGRDRDVRRVGRCRDQSVRSDRASGESGPEETGADGRRPTIAG